VRSEAETVLVDTRCAVSFKQICFCVWASALERAAEDVPGRSFYIGWAQTNITD